MRMDKEYDIVALGELLIDFTSAGISENGSLLFEQNPGGAPVNMLTAAEKAGLKTAFIGKVGNDMHGKFLLDIVKNKQLYIITFIRMILVPAIVYGFMRILGFTGLLLNACTIISALPTGTMTSIVATDFHCEPDYAAKAMVQTLVAMVITLPLWIMIVQI